MTTKNLILGSAIALVMTASAAMAQPNDAQPAANCQISSDREIPAGTVAQQIEAGKPATVGQYLRIVGSTIPSSDPIFAGVADECKTLIGMGTLQVNGLKASDPISVLAGKSLHLGTIARVVAPAIPAPQATATPAAQPLPNPALERAHADLATAKADRVRIKKQLAPVRLRPASVTPTSGERALQNRLVKVEGQIVTLTGLVARLKKVEDDVAALKASDVAQNTRLDSAEATNVNQNNILVDIVGSEAKPGGRLGAVEDALAGGQGMSWWLKAFLGILGLSVLGLFVRSRNTNKRVKTVEVDNHVETVNRLGVHIPDDMEDQLLALSAGESCNIPIQADGSVYPVCLTRCNGGMLGNFEKASVVTDDIHRQTQPMNVETLRSTLLRHIKAGRLSAATIQPRPTAATPLAAVGP